jgi:AP-2 complex subunit alpha
MSSMLDSFSETAMSALSSVSIPSLSTELFSSALSQGQPNGLHNFIKDIRDVKSKEEERVRVDKELGNIRKKFAQSSSLTSYQKKKYVWKMCYIYMLGYEVDFGHMEFISLLSSTKFQEKSVGYMAVALFLKPGDELMTLVINSIRNDIVGRLNFGQTLALSAVSNVGGTDLAEALSADVQKFLTPISDLSQYSFGSNADVEMRNRTSVVKKAALCLLRLYRTNPDCLSVPDWVEKLSKLLEDRDLGIVTSVMSLILGLLAQPQNVQCLSALIPFVISVIVKLTILKTSAESYYYYKIASPWLQVKCLKFLQYYDFPEAQHRELLTDALVQILTKTEISESVNKTNADYSIIYEAVTLVINYGPDMDDRLRGPTFTFLGKFISTNEPNIRYIGLDLMNFVLKREDASSVRMYQRNVLESLKDTDISVRKRALENMFSLTDEDNVREIIDELLVVLTTTESGIKEDFVVKIAILTEKFYAGDLKWYIDIMVKMFLIAGDYIAEAIWHRIVLIVTNHPEVHEYAAEKLFECVKAKFIPDILIALAGYLLGEIGINICEKPDMSGYEQFAALHQHFQLSSLKTQSVLLTTYVKLMNLYPDTKDAILEVFQKHSTSMQLEIQQRACEYIKMPSIGAEIMEQVISSTYYYTY